jgi:hypothetical protein
MGMGVLGRWIQRYRIDIRTPPATPASRNLWGFLSRSLHLSESLIDFIPLSPLCSRSSLASIRASCRRVVVVVQVVAGQWHPRPLFSSVVLAFCMRLRARVCV